jgi:MFS family permease
VPSPRRNFLVLCAATFFHFVAMGMYLAALPLYVSRELDGSRAAVGLAVGAFSISAVLSRPWVGRRVDRFGRKVFLVGAPLLIAATAFSLFAATALAAVVAVRLVQGLAGAAYYTSAATMATDLSPEDRRADFIARFSLFLYAGFAAGPALAEWLIASRGFGWAWTASAFAATIGALVALQLPETRPAQLDTGPARRRLVHPAALGPGLVLLTIAVGYTSISAFTPLYAREVGMGSSGPLFVTFALTIFVVRMGSGRLADRFGRVIVASPGLALGVAGLTLLALVPRPAAAFAGIAAFAACHALAFPALMALTVDAVPDSERGEALGSFTAYFDVGAAVGGSAVGWIADAAGFGSAWLAAAAVCLVGFGVVLKIGHRVRAEAATAAGAALHPEPAGT